MKLSIIIVNYNVRYYLEQCLLSVERALKGIDAEVIVIDNHSQDGSVRYLSGHFPNVNFISLNHNLGFAKANNKGISISRGEYVLMLNPDTIIGEDVLRHVVEFMDNHERCGGLGLQMLGINGKRAMESRRGIPTPLTAFYKMTGLCARFPNHPRYGKYYMCKLPWDKPNRIEVVSGAFFLLRRKALDEIGLLDETFFMYGEDIDLSYRLLKKGWENWYVPDKIIHYKGESTEKSSFRYVHVFYEAMLIFFKKHYGQFNVFLTFPIQIAIYAKALMALLSLQVTRARRSMGFVRQKPSVDLTYIFLTNDENISDCKRIAEFNGLCAEFSTDSIHHFDFASIENGYVVFDVSCYKFRDIIETMSSMNQPNIKLATYNSERHVVITDDDVFQVEY